MFVVYGVHVKAHPLAQRQMYCTSCNRQTSVVYVVVKKAFHVFWIPLVPAGSSTHMTCTDCGSVWEMSKVPLDLSYWGYLFLSIGLFIGGVVVSYVLGLPCLTSLVLIIPTIMVSIIYLYVVPSSLREHFEKVAMDALSTNVGGGAAPRSTIGYTDPYLAPQTAARYSAPYGTYVPPSPMAGSIYAPTYPTFTSCPSCGMRMETPPPGAVGTCPYCQSPFRK